MDQEDEDDDLDEKSDDDEFIDGLKKQQQKKQKFQDGGLDDIDLDKLTRRQKMAYFQKNKNNLL